LRLREVLSLNQRKRSLAGGKDNGDSKLATTIFGETHPQAGAMVTLVRLWLAAHLRLDGIVFMDMEVTSAKSIRAIIASRF
jgi:hypothetical protein